jgi:hypothetical protein
MVSWSAASPEDLCIQTADRTNAPITDKTPTESSRDRLQAGPEQGSTSVSVAHAKTPADRMDAIPPIQSGRSGRSQATSNQSADDTMVAPPRRKSTPKPTKVADSAAHSRTTREPTRTGTSPYSSGRARQVRPMLRFGMSLSTVRHCTVLLAKNLYSAK